MPNEFLTRLNDIGQQSLLGGNIRAAAAKGMGKRLEATSKVVSNLNERIRQVESPDLQTGEERIKILSEDSDVKESMSGVQDAAVAYQKLDGRIRARQEEYEKIYGEAFQTLGLIGGEQAGQMGTILEGQLKAKTGRLSKELEAPLRQIQYSAAVQSFEWNQEKYDDYVTQKGLSKDAAEVSEYMQQMPEWFELPQGKLSFRNKSSLEAHNKQVAGLKAKAREHFKQKGAEFSDEAFELAFKNSADMSGLSWSWMEQIPKIDNATGDKLIKHENAKGALKHYSNMWRWMDPKLKTAVKHVMRGGDAESITTTDGEEFDKKGVEEMAHIFGPTNGKGQQSAYFLAYHTARTGDAAGMGYTDQGFQAEGQNIKAYGSLYYPSNAYAFLNDTFDYQPIVPDVGRQTFATAEEYASDVDNPFSMWGAYIRRGELIQDVRDKARNAKIIAEEKEL